jgi:hypothetical protein
MTTRALVTTEIGAIAERYSGERDFQNATLTNGRVGGRESRRALGTAVVAVREEGKDTPAHATRG